MFTPYTTGYLVDTLHIFHRPEPGITFDPVRPVHKGLSRIHEVNHILL